MKINKLSAGVLCLTLLTACSGGGNHDYVENTMIKPLTKDDIQGGYIDISDKSGSVIKTGGKNILLIDGKTFDLHNLSNDYDKTSTFMFGQFSTVGYLYSPGKNEVLLYQGDISHDTPDHGVVKYHGKALQVREDHGKSTLIPMRSEFTVDFTNKRLEGDIIPYSSKMLIDSNGNVLTASLIPVQAAMGKPVKIHAELNGNTFSGTKDGITAKGGFYGPKAAELGGAYYNKTKDLGGVFKADVAE